MKLKKQLFAHGVLTKAAKVLGISTVAVYKRIQKHHLPTVLLCKQIEDRMRSDKEKAAQILSND